jgi:hypothetical protein
MARLLVRWCNPYLLRALQRIWQRPLHTALQQQHRLNMTTFKLNTGASIPALGFGTWQDKEDQEKAVTEALKAGVRHIDTARGEFS